MCAVISGRDVETFGIEAEALLKSRRFDAELSDLVTVFAVLVAWRIATPRQHPIAGFLRERLAEKIVELRDDRQRIILERREMHVEEAMLVDGISERDPLAHHAFPHPPVPCAELIK